MLAEPKVIQTQAQPAAVIRVTVPRDQIQEAMCPAITEVMQTASAQGIGPAGPVFAHHFKVDPAVFDFEVGVPVSGPVTPTGRVKAGELPAAKVVRTVYTGPYEDLGAAWGEFIARVEADGHTSAPNAWEVYLTGPQSSPDPATWQTELNRPIL